MTFTVENLAPAHAVILVTHTGDVTASEMRAVGRQIQAMAAGSTPVRVLSDYAGATSMPGAIELLALIDLLEEAGVGSGFRQALVWPEDDDARLGIDVWRTAETNEGLKAKAFGDRESALAWLEA